MARHRRKATAYHLILETNPNVAYRVPVTSRPSAEQADKFMKKLRAYAPKSSFLVETVVTQEPEHRRGHI